jgi:NitT/TauT family transport system substrate-binding protein
VNRESFLRVFPLAATAVALPSLPALAAPVALRVGATANDTYAQAYYAQDMGFFTKAGLDVTITTLRSGSDVAAGIASGALDVGVSNPVQLASAITHGLPFVYFAGGAFYNSDVPTTVLCVAKDSPFKTVKELEGRTIALNALKDISALGAQGYLADHGADLSKVQFIEIPFAEMGPALQKGTIAAALISEPSLTAATDAGYVRTFANVFDAIAKRFYISGWFAMSDWYKGHVSVAKQFASVMYETARWANAHQPESAAILEKYSKISTEVARRMARATYDTTLNPDYLRPPLQLAARAKLTDRLVATAEMTAR